jgi:PhnB protein
MHVSAYLHYDGNCGEAIVFYVQALGAKLERKEIFEGSPAASMAPPDWGRKILHAQLRVGDSEILMSDAPPGRFRPMQGFSLSVIADSAADAERIFAALGQGGTVTMPMAESFFAERFGMLTDKFGVPWMVVRDRER